MTRGDHPTGTDRLAEAVARLGLPADAIVVNVQGDEPLIEPELIDAVAAKLQASPEADIATCACPLADAEALFNPNVVKLVCAADDRALYLRAPPAPGPATRWPAANLRAGRGAARVAPHRPVCVPGVVPAPLSSLPRALDVSESLEQLRAAWSLGTSSLVVHRASHHSAAGVDTPADLERVRLVYSKQI